MNLEFFDVQEFPEFTLQKANVTYNKRFWYQWRQAQALEKSALLLNAEVPKDFLTSVLVLRREIIDGEKHWFVFRKKGKSSEIPKKFSMSYSIRDTSKLLPYQPESLQHLCNSMIVHGAAVDSSDTGLGKTYTAIAVARELHYKPAIICKIAGIPTWRKACEHFKISPLFIINWESAKSKNFEYLAKNPFVWKIPKNTLLIFDEVHSASNLTSDNSKMFMASRGIPSLSLSATIADRPEQLAPLFHVLDICDKENFKSFIKSQGAIFVKTENGEEALSDIEEMKRLNSILFPYFGYRLSYNNPKVKKYFPEAVYQSAIISIGQKTEAQNKLYAETVEKSKMLKEKGDQAGKLVAELRYRQATELLKVNTVAEMAKDLISQNHSVVIFVNYRETLAALAKALKTKSLIFGNQDKLGFNRENIIDKFQNDESRIILATNDAGGQSISLHDITGKHPRVSLIFPTYKAKALKQTAGRTYRAGSKTTPIIKLVFAAGTIEEKVADSVNAKLSNISALNDGDLLENDLFNIGEDYECLH